MKYPEPKPWAVVEVVQTYKLLQIGMSYEDIKKIEHSEAEALIDLYDTIKEYEQEEMEKSEKKMKRNTKTWQN